MKAVVQDRYGPPEVLRVVDVAVPTPADDEVLVRVAATSLNLTDWEGLQGSPAYARIGGLWSPARPTLGSDIAGRVETVGRDVTAFGPGDEVFGDNLGLKGGFAEYAVVPETALARRPERLDAARASTIPQSGAIAVQGTALLEPGRRLLINGGGGGSGMFAIQLAKTVGAHVTAVDNADKLEFMSSLGADEVIDYRRDDFTRDRDRFDLILDLVGYGSVLALRRALAPGGRYCYIGGPVSKLLKVMTIGAVAGRLSGRRLGLLAVQQGPDGFGPLTDRCVAGDVTVHIDRTFGLDEVPEALALLGRGAFRGKAVVEVA